MKLGHHRARPAALGRPARHGVGCGGAAGAALVELAFVALFIATISAGAYDYGMAYREALAVNEAARTGVRTGSALGTNWQADYYALSGAKAALAGEQQAGRRAAGGHLQVDHRGRQPAGRVHDGHRRAPWRAT